MKLKLLISIIFLVALFGCIPNPSTKNTFISSTPTLKLATSTPTIGLQITYSSDEQNQSFSNFYTIDITCMTRDKVCFDEPKLLFKSLKTPSEERFKPKGFLADYRWSPDGNKIALISDRDILIGNMITQDWANITNNPDGIDEHDPQWASDGNSIYYISCSRYSSGMCIPQLVSFDLIKKEKLQLLGRLPKSITPTPNYAIAPDGQKIIFSISGSQGNYLLYEAKLNGEDSRQITTEDVNETDPSFSSDGQKIVFVRSTIKYNADSKEESDIIVKDLISGEEKNLTDNFDGLVSSPVFSPDGKWILFFSFDKNLDTNIFLVSLEQGKLIQVTTSNKGAFPVWRRILGQ